MTLNKSKFIFLCGLHKSGTSILHEILRSHPDISGLINTGAPEDEGQHLQSVYPSAKAFGGPGRFGFNNSSFMDENHPLASEDNALKILMEWQKYYEKGKSFYIEKSPPNLVRTRFLQRLFPQSLFITILRHPIAVSYATRKWRRMKRISSLIEHSLRCYERFYNDMPYLNRVFVLQYENFVLNNNLIVEEIYKWIGVKPTKSNIYVKSNINRNYFSKFNSDFKHPIKKMLLGLSTLTEKFEKRANLFGYSMKNIEALLPIDWMR